MIILALLVLCLIILGFVAVYLHRARVRYIYFYFVCIAICLDIIAICIACGSWLQTADQWIAEKIKTYLLQNDPSMIASLSAVKQTLDITNHVTVIFSLGIACLSMMKVRQGGHQNPYQLDKYYGIRINIAFLFSFFGMHLVFMLLNCPVFEVICLLGLIFTSLEFITFFNLHHEKENIRLIMADQLKKKMVKNKRLFERANIWCSNRRYRKRRTSKKKPNISQPASEPGAANRLTRTKSKSIEESRDAIKEVSMWGTYLLDQRIVEEEGYERQAEHVIGAIKLFFDVHKSVYEMNGSHPLPFSLGISLLNPRPEIDKDHYRKLFCALLRAANQADFGYNQDEGRALLEGLICSRLKYEMDHLDEPHSPLQNADYDEFKATIKEVYSDTLSNLGIVQDSEPVRGYDPIQLLQKNRRIWMMIAISYCSRKLDLKKLDETVMTIEHMDKHNMYYPMKSEKEIFSEIVTAYDIISNGVNLPSDIDEVDKCWNLIMKYEKRRNTRNRRKSKPEKFNVPIKK